MPALQIKEKIVSYWPAADIASTATLDEARRYLAINAIPTGSRQNESQEYILIRKLVSSLGSVHKASDLKTALITELERTAIVNATNAEVQRR